MRPVSSTKNGSDHPTFENYPGIRNLLVQQVPEEAEHLENA
jgi:hypothetical protein